MAAFEAGELQFFADLVHLNQANVFAAALTPLRTVEWVVYAKRTFAGPEQLLAYWLGTRIVSPSLTIACSSLMRPTSGSAGKRPGKAAVISAK